MHGVPTRRRLADGDLVSIDFGADVDGWHGDAAISFTVGTARPADLALIEATHRALQAGIAACRPGARLGDVSHAVGSIGRAAGYGLLANHGGHGVGRAMHELPHVPNEGRPGREPPEHRLWQLGEDLDRAQQRPLDQEALGEELALGAARVERMCALEQADLEDLPGIVPLVDRGSDVEPLVALQPDQRPLQRR